MLGGTACDGVESPHLQVLNAIADLHDRASRLMTYHHRLVHDKVAEVPLRLHRRRSIQAAVCVSASLLDVQHFHMTQNSDARQSNHEAHVTGNVLQYSSGPAHSIR